VPDENRFASWFRPVMALALAFALNEGRGFGQDHGTMTLTCLEMTEVNRGAGLAVILETPGGKTYLYDTGVGYPDGDGWAGGYNAGRDTIAPYLVAKGIKALDGVLISHAHYDHFGGLLWLEDHVPIVRLYDSGFHFRGEGPANYTKELGDYEALRDRFKAKTGAYRAAHAGDRLDLDDRLKVEVVAPPQGFFTEPHPETRPKSDPPAHYLVNANSLGVRITHGTVTFLLPGDIQKEDQVRSLLPSVAPGKLRCQVLVAPAHGIHAVPEFAAAARPEITIASAPPRYAKSSPAPKVYGAVGSQVFLTGLHGRVTVVSDGTSYTVNAERPEVKPAAARPNPTEGR
jgi:competence protein ComEC